jgi:dephospho-CoA kinase
MLVVPLLIESGTYRERVRRLCVVDCPEDVQVARVMQRSGLEERQVRAIMAAQASRAERLAAADVVDNAAAYARCGPGGAPAWGLPAPGGAGGGRVI